jgi:hypothetical protein
MSDYLFKTVVW